MTHTHGKVAPTGLFNHEEDARELNIPIRFINPSQSQNYLDVFTVKDHARLSVTRSDCLNKVPLFNVLYHTLLNHDHIDNEYLRGFLDLLGVTTGLLLSAVVAFPLSVDFAEIEKARERFARAPYNQSRWGRTANGVDPLVVQLSTFTTASLYLLGTAITLVIMFFFFSGMNESNAPNVPKMSKLCPQPIP